MGKLDHPEIKKILIAEVITEGEVYRENDK